MTRTVAVVKLRSYGFLHPGRERFKRVTKECWRFIPGATLYGAVAASLIRQECKKGCATVENCRACVNTGETECGYASLLGEAKNTKENAWRFSPLIPVKDENRKEEDYTLKVYCEDAVDLRPRMAIVPRAPQDRFSGSISENRLHGVVAHMPFQDYWGFIIAPETFVRQHLYRALTALPFFPFGGGRGKFVQVEAEMIRTMTVEEFIQELTNISAPCAVKLLTPAIEPGADDLKIIAGGRGFNWVGFRPRLYSTWRTGLYWEDGNLVEYGGKQNTTTPRLGIEQGAWISFGDNLSDVVKLKDLLVSGLGNSDFARLGWGQMILKEKAS